METYFNMTEKEQLRRLKAFVNELMDEHAVRMSSPAITNVCLRHEVINKSTYKKADWLNNTLCVLSHALNFK